MSSDSAEINKKVLSYETFLNETLRGDLRKILENRDEIYSEIAEYLELKNTIDKLKEADFSSEALKTKIDLGCNFYVQANIANSSTICVSVGYGFYVEMALPEALRFIEKKVTHLTTKAARVTDDAARVKAHSKLVIEGLREVQGFKSESETPHINLWDL